MKNYLSIALLAAWVAFAGCWKPVAGAIENSPAIYGWVMRQTNQSSPVRDGRTVLSSLTGLWKMNRTVYPAINGWAIFGDDFQGRHFHLRELAGLLSADKLI